MEQRGVGSCCRICLSEDEVSNLIAPCECRGSARYVHSACLETWRSKNTDSWKVDLCSVCHSRFKGVAAVPSPRQKEKKSSFLSMLGGGFGGTRSLPEMSLRPGVLLTSAPAADLEPSSAVSNALDDFRATLAGDTRGTCYCGRWQVERVVRMRGPAAVSRRAGR